MLEAVPTTLYFTGNKSNTIVSLVGGQSNFSLDAAGANASAILPGSVTDVQFAAGANTTAANFTTTLNGDLTVNSLNFGGGVNGTTPVTINGTKTFTIKASAGNGIVINSGAAANTINANVTLASNQGWTNNSASTFTVNGAVNLGSSSLTVAGLMRRRRA